MTVRAEPLPTTPEAPARPAGLTVESLYRQHFDFVWRNARRLGCSDEWVDDATHEVFLTAARRLSEFEGRANVRTWLFAITLRVVQRLRRNRARYAARLQRYHGLAGDDSVDPAQQRDDAAYLRHLLSRLDDDKRAVVILAELEGMTSAEIADALGCKQGTVDSRLRAARIALTRMIEQDRARERRHR